MKISSTLTVLALCFLGQSAFAQSEAEQEMMRLFRSVEKRLKAIDALLSDASTGVGSTSTLESIGESGIDEILKASRDQSAEVIESIDRILEISQSQQSSSGSGSGSEPSAQPSPGEQPGGSPLDRGQQSTPRENTPEAGGEEPSEKPGEKPGGEQPSGNKPDKPGTEPKDGSETPDPNPKNTPAGAAPASPAGTPSTAAGLERWGELPQHAQSVFRSEGGTELPAQYRDWIDAYHRRLNKESGRR